MKKLSFFACLLFFFSFFQAFSGLREVEELSVYYKKEILDGKTFVYREDIANGVKKQVWTIDGVQVSQEDFEETLLETEKEVRRKERRQQMVRREALQQERSVAVIALHKKLLRLLIEQVQAELKKFEDHRLGPFLLFDESFSREQFEAIEQELLQNAKQVLYNAGDDGDVSQLAVMIEKLDGLATRLHNLFQTTVNRAIKQCDDTRMLKDLLAIVSS